MAKWSKTSDFRQVDVYPTRDELQGYRTPFRQNIICGRFHSVEHYLDTQFRLLREDFVSSLREGIEKYRSGAFSKTLDLYQNVQIHKGKIRRNEDCFKIQIKTKKEEKKFMTGSLLLFTTDNFKTIFLAKVVQNYDTEVVIDLINSDVSLGRSFTMAECSNYFDTYYQVLQALKSMPVDDFPMRKYIVDVDASHIYLPEYLCPFLNSQYQIENFSFPLKELPKFSHCFYGQNESQNAAFKAALTQEFVVIQGPPGTGKTRLAIQIAQTLIRNCHTWYRNSPLLVISFKNDALDQLLEGLVPATHRLVRVGGQSKSVKLKPFNLTNPMGKKRPKSENLATMRNALVVGMTTTIAARWKSDLEQLKSPIVIVEEAAEILEAHVVAALTSKCQHLILLGDHLQLQPNTADHQLGKNYNLQVSLFERMVRNGIRCFQLDTQHRMRPEISTLATNIYPFLKDHPNVRDRPAIRGVAKNLFFLDHKQPEAVCNGTSRKNVHEAEFLVAFARYLLQMGYRANEVVLLATYAGQVVEMSELAKKDASLAGVKIASVDGFQGQEAEVVLLSLVRSEELGFLDKENRVCVALSRARSGMYIMGNMDLLVRSKIWRKIKKNLEEQDAIGEALKIGCNEHGGVGEISTVEQWRLLKYCDRCIRGNSKRADNSSEFYIMCGVFGLAISVFCFYYFTYNFKTVAHVKDKDDLPAFVYDKYKHLL